ncbi:hypothetical protein RM844_30570 [Streptomyces sp. DSM 44915]|uniref:Uncharacterized protein n=1 Tax=Streptomyces chisholmiae TaxID=3075540 RepID=A0ABU2K045_9ACTN|nr:hypothetical protein [Streptomyces sp. DSM 44915]MDT0270626.1 hypothetical protein [Streptomyces sp. DSM 44915]
MVRAIRVPELPGGAAIIIDDQPGSVIIWIRDTLTAGEVADMLAEVWSISEQRGLWRRMPAAA